MKKFLCLAAAASLICFAACEKETATEGGEKTVAVESVALDVTELNLVEGEEATLTATVLPEDATDKTVVWSTSNAEVATVEEGVVKAVAPGSAVVTATAGEESAECTVTVEAAVVPVESVVLDVTELNLVEGEEATLTATVLPEEATDKTVVWSTSDAAVATVEGGVVKAVAPGSAVITATAGEKSAECAVTVAPNNIVVYGGVTYTTVALADGNVWFAENLRYVPEGKTVSSNPADKNGIWYPATKDKVADPSLVETKGLLYSAEVAFGAEITVENAASFEGCQGICPEGWHIPTNAEMSGLVGHNSNSAYVNTNAPYYDANAKGALIPTLNEAGFNWTSVGTVNVTNTAATGAYLVTTYGDIVGAMSYVWGSTNYQVATNDDGSIKNVQYYSFMSTVNASNNKVTVAYGNFKSGYSVRCVKNK